MTRLYNGAERGYPGDEDQGQTSSWFVLSAMGLYAVCPGTDQYVPGSPLYPKMTVTFEDGKKLVIESENHSPQVTGEEPGLVCGWEFTSTVPDDGNIPDITGRYSARLAGNYRWNIL